MPVELLYQLPIIHNRHKYKGEKGGYPEKCYEWSRNRDSWETLLVWFAIADGSALVKPPGSKLHAPVPGLAIEQVITMVTDFYGPKEAACGQSTTTQREVMPFPGNGIGLLGQVLVGRVLDAQVLSIPWALGCQLEPEFLCHMVTNVTCTVQLVSAAVNGAPLDESMVAKGDVARPVSGTREVRYKEGGEKYRVAERVFPEVKITSLDNQKTTSHSYTAEIDHCDDTGLVTVAWDRDVSAGEVPKSLRPPPEELRRIMEAISAVDPSSARGFAQLESPSPVPPSSVTMASAFGSILRPSVDQIEGQVAERWVRNSAVHW